MATRGSSTAEVTETIEERAARAIRRRDGQLATVRPIDEIRPTRVEGTPDKSAGAYYLRPEGATIADCLIYYPNGAQLSQEDDPKGRYSENASYYQERQRRKGFEYVGPTLTVVGAKRLVEILAKNQPAEIERLEDEIALSELTIKNTETPSIRDYERKRRQALNARLERVRTPFDPEALVKQLEEIANAQEMATVPPQIMRVMRRMIGAQSADFESMVRRFTKTAGDGEDHTPQDGAAVVE